jgi:hypothetical protein
MVVSTPRAGLTTIDLAVRLEGFLAAAASRISFRKGFELDAKTTSPYQSAPNFTFPGFGFRCGYDYAQPGADAKADGCTDGGCGRA